MKKLVVLGSLYLAAYALGVFISWDIFWLTPWDWDVNDRFGFVLVLAGATYIAWGVKDGLI